MIYLASPYSHVDENVRNERFHKVTKKCAQMARRGINVYSPIMHWHPAAYIHSLPTDAEFWRSSNFEHILHSTALWVLRLDGWEDSNGVREEMEFAHENRLPIVFVDLIEEAPLDSSVS